MSGSHAHLRLRRTGGIAGVATEAELDTSELDPAQAEPILKALDATQGRPTGGGPPLPDAFRYELTVERAGQSRTVTFGDPPPAELAPVIEALSARSRVAPRRQR
jgi:hypothetical protein